MLPAIHHKVRLALPLVILMIILSHGAVAQQCSMQFQWEGSYWGDRSGSVSASFTQSGTAVSGSVNGYSVTGTNDGSSVTLSHTGHHGYGSASGSFSTDCSTVSGSWIVVKRKNGHTKKHTGGFSINMPIPVNYQQVGPGIAQPDGVLQFNYSWASSTGSPGDLSQCAVGERVTYPGSDPFFWPSPPYAADSSVSNPTIAWIPATDVAAQDNHSHEDFLAPYTQNKFTASQTYRYQCSPDPPVKFADWTGIPIVRTVFQIVGSSCYEYTVTKSGYSNSVSPLPGCTQEISAEPEWVNGVDLTGAELSFAPSEFVVGSREPVLVTFTAQNLLSQTLHLDLGLNKKAIFEFVIEEPAGTIVTGRANPGGFGTSGRIDVAPGSTFTERLLLNEWYDFQTPGTYHVSVRMLDDQTGEPYTLADQPGLHFTLQIDPRNPDALERLCRLLADATASSTSIAEKMEAANTLGHITDPVAIPYLARVLESGSLLAHYAIEGLGRIATPDAITILTAALQHNDPDVRAAAQYELARLKAGGPVD